MQNQLLNLFDAIKKEFFVQSINIRINVYAAPAFEDFDHSVQQALNAVFNEDYFVLGSAHSSNTGSVATRAGFPNMLAS